MAETCLFDVQPLKLEDQEYIKRNLWPKSDLSSIDEYRSYFNFFHGEISSLTFPRNHPIDHKKFAMESCSDFTKVAKLMESNVDRKRTEIASEIGERFPNTTKAQQIRSMELTVRLWLTLHVRSPDYAVGNMSVVEDIEWLDNTTLNEMVKNCFPKSTYTPSEPDLRISRSFTMPTIRKLCRVKVHWTHNLKDHLYYDYSRTTVHIYPHKTILISHLNEPCEVLPKGLLTETIRTLELLFPVYEESTLKYLKSQNQDFYRDPTMHVSPATNFGEFDYWRRRLVELHDVFHQAPRSIPQMWNDRRNPMQWWTFWLAAFFSVLTVVFGVLSSYTGFWQLKHAEKSYELALLQACASNSPPMSLCNKISRSF